jgi:hypothetical protein
MPGANLAARAFMAFGWKIALTPNVFRARAMAGPPPYIFAPTIAVAALARQVVELEPPPRPDQPRRQLRPKRPRRGVIAQVLAWILGIGGYAGLVIISHGSRHADDLRALAVVWLITFGALNAHFILRRR